MKACGKLWQFAKRSMEIPWKLCFNCHSRCNNKSNTRG